MYWAQPNHTLMGNFLTKAMYSSQWNLYNTGQFGGNGGYDINVQPVWNSLNFTGMGIEVAVIDEGVDVNHPSLRICYPQLKKGFVKRQKHSKKNTYICNFDRIEKQHYY